MTTDKKARKEMPVAEGVLDYFPDAIAEVAHVSYVGNQQHNPGEPMHWAKEKSRDHADCVARHLIERGTIDEDGLRHAAKMAWRALALLQAEIEEDAKPNQRAVVQDLTTPSSPRVSDMARLVALGCPAEVATLISKGITYSAVCSDRYVYVAGPMRGIPDFNYPAFDAARNDLVSRGWNVVSPADIDRADGKHGHGVASEPPPLPIIEYVFRDFYTLYFLAKHNPARCNAVYLLTGWGHSTGAQAERALAQWLGLAIPREKL